MSGKRKKKAAAAGAASSVKSSPPPQDDDYDDDGGGGSIGVVPDPLIYHAVRVGRSVRSCVFLRWSDAERHVLDFADAEYESFEDVDDAVVFALFGPEGGGEEGGECAGSEEEKEKHLVEEEDEDEDDEDEDEEAAMMKGEVDVDEAIEDDEDDDGHYEGRRKTRAMISREKETKKKRGRSRGRGRKRKGGRDDEVKAEATTTPQRQTRTRTRAKAAVTAATATADAGGGGGGGGTGETLPTARGYDTARKKKATPNVRWMGSYDRLKSYVESTSPCGITTSTNFVDIDPEDEEHADLRKWLKLQVSQIRGAWKETRDWEAGRRTGRPGWRGDKPPPPPKPLFAEKARLLEEIGVKIFENNDRHGGGKGAGGVVGDGGRGLLPLASPRKDWMASLEQLRSYKERTGTFEIDADDEENAHLRGWLGRMATELRKGRRTTADDDDGGGGGGGLCGYVDVKTGEPSPLLAEKARLLLDEVGYVLPPDNDDEGTTPKKRRRGSSAGEGGKGEGPQGGVKPTRSPRGPATEIREKWRENLERMKEYREAHGGTVRIDPKDEEHAPLRRWWCHQVDTIRKMMMVDDDEGEGGDGDGSGKGIVDPADCDKLSPVWKEKARLMEELDEDLWSSAAASSRTVSQHHPSRFDEMIERYRRYKSEHDGEDPPPDASQDDPPTRELRLWIRRQKEQYKKMKNGDTTSKMTARALEKLTEAGMDFGRKQRPEWLESFDRLKRLKEATGSANIDPDDEDHAETRRWLKKQKYVIRSEFKKHNGGNNWTPGKKDGGGGTDPPSPPSAVLAEKVRKLEELGVSLWDNDDNEGGASRERRSTGPRFAAMLDRLRAHREATGTFEIDPDDADNDDLRRWLGRLDSDLRRGRVAGADDDGGSGGAGTGGTYSYVDPRTRKVSPLLAEKARKLEEIGYELPEGLDDVEGGGGGGRGRGRAASTTITQEWRDYLERMRTYKEMTGTVHIQVKDEENAMLRRWWYRQHTAIRKMMENDQEGKGGLSAVWREKARLIQELDENMGVGAPGIYHPSRFDEMLDRYKLYTGADRPGGGPRIDLPPKSDDPQVSELLRWVQRQRNEYAKLRAGKDSVLTARRLTQLTEAGMVLGSKNKPRVSWEERLEQLRQYKAEHGHLRIPSRHPVLGEFVRAKRKEYNKFVEGRCSSTGVIKDQIRDLVQLDFVFSAGKKWTPPTEPNKPWEARFEELLEYRATYGHCVVPKSYPGLGQWVTQQRAQYSYLKKGRPSRMTPERVVQLTDAGFVWDATGKQNQGTF